MCVCVGASTHADTLLVPPGLNEAFTQKREAGKRHVKKEKRQIERKKTRDRTKPEERQMERDTKNKKERI